MKLLFIWKSLIIGRGRNIYLCEVGEEEEEEEGEEEGEVEGEGEV